MIPIKTAGEMDKMRCAGAALSRIACRIRSLIKPGMKTIEIDQIVCDLIREQKAVPAFKGYRGFPACVCTSLNEEVVHGIPSDRCLKEGDLLKVDIGIELDGYFADCAFSVTLGEVNGRIRRLVEATKHALDLGIAQAKAENRLMDISWAIQAYIESCGFSVVRDFVGHGIGIQMHEPPEIPNFGRPHSGPVLREGMVLAIEPMVNMGTWEVSVGDNGWTAATKDGLESAHFEHTVAVTSSGPEVLTR